MKNKQIKRLIQNLYDERNAKLQNVAKMVLKANATEDVAQIENLIKDYSIEDLLELDEIIMNSIKGEN